MHAASLPRMELVLSNSHLKLLVGDTQLVDYLRT
jgi:hypothetical protein